MNDTVKKYVRVSLTLGLIAGIAALLIGLTNMVTADKITQNAKEKEKNGLTEVFTAKEGTSYTYNEEKDIGTFAYIQKIWIVSDSVSDIGLIYKTSGKNAYGSVTMLLGLSGEKDLGKMVILENTETYGQTLQDNYISPYNSATDKNNAVADVTCGATFGAKLIKSMADEALSDYLVRIK
ncbi:MAG: hypothetical protein WCS80_00040 [Bacilli bacterium]